MEGGGCLRDGAMHLQSLVPWSRELANFFSCTSFFLYCSGISCSFWGGKLLQISLGFLALEDIRELREARARGEWRKLRVCISSLGGGKERCDGRFYSVASMSTWPLKELQVADDLVADVQHQQSCGVPSPHCFPHWLVMVMAIKAVKVRVI